MMSEWYQKRKLTGEELESRYFIDDFQIAFFFSDLDNYEFINVDGSSFGSENSVSVDKDIADKDGD